MSYFKAKMHQNPAHSASPNPQLDLRGLLLSGGEGREGKWSWEGRDGRGGMGWEWSLVESKKSLK